MKKVLFLINSLGGGGAERVLVNLVNNMDKSRYDVTVQTIFPAGVNKEYLNKDVTLIEGNLPMFKGISMLFKALPEKLLSKLIDDKKYDVLIAYMHGLPTKMISGTNRKETLAWLHSDMHHSSLPKFFSTEQIIKSFDKFYKIVGVSNTVCDSFEDMYGLKDKLTVIYNTNDTKKIRTLSENKAADFSVWQDYEGVKLITVGRLTSEKGYERLINICDKLKTQNLNFKLLILGDGIERAKLQAQIDSLNLNDTIILGGFTNNPYPYMKKADLFVCSSIFEGLSTVTTESVILGTPAISTDVSGAKEILGESEYGVVVENNEQALTDGLADLISNPQKIEYYKTKAIERAPFFETERTVKAVEDLIDEVMTCKN